LHTRSQYLKSPATQNTDSISGARSHPELLPSLRRTDGCINRALAVVAVLFASFYTQAEVTVPDTPARHILQAFLDAFDSGDHDRIAAYVKEYDPENSADGLTSFSSQTGGFTLTSILGSTPDKLTFLVRGR
jgi:hypothetical protein